MPEIMDKRVTSEEMLAISDDKLWELVDGRLVEKNVGYWANRVAFVLGWFIESYLRQNSIEGIVVIEGPYECAPWSKIKVRKPDVSVVLAGRFPGNRIPSGHSTVAPDLAVEVISPNDLAYDLDQKVHDYVQAGVKEIWLINPEMKTVYIKRKDGTPSELDENSTLKSENLLPGFALKVSELFQ